MSPTQRWQLWVCRQTALRLEPLKEPLGHCYVHKVWTVTQSVGTAALITYVWLEITVERCLVKTECDRKHLLSGILGNTCSFTSRRVSILLCKTLDAPTKSWIQLLPSLLSLTGKKALGEEVTKRNKARKEGKEGGREGRQSERENRRMRWKWGGPGLSACLCVDRGEDKTRRNINWKNCQERDSRCWQCKCPREHKIYRYWTPEHLWENPLFNEYHQGSRPKTERLECIHANRKPAIVYQ